MHLPSNWFKPRQFALSWLLIILGLVGLFVYQANTKGVLPVETNILALLPDNQQDRDMIARELLIKFQMSKSHPMVDLMGAYRKF